MVECSNGDTCLHYLEKDELKGANWFHLICAKLPHWKDPPDNWLCKKCNPPIKKNRQNQTFKQIENIEI